MPIQGSPSKTLPPEQRGDLERERVEPPGSEARPPIQRARMELDAMKVLVVDDEAPIRQAVRRVASSMGIEVVEACSGREAIDRLDDEAMDLVLTDIYMPDMDGMCVLKHVAEHDLDTPVILITGRPTLDTAIRAVDQGAFQYLTKPFTVHQLRQVLDRAVQLRRMVRLKRQALSLTGLPGGRSGGMKALEASFQRAISSCWMAFQPIVSAAGGHVVGYEALLRSEEPTLPHPGAVLHAAERLARVEELGRTVRRLTAAAAQSDPRRALLFVNLHPLDLLDEELYRSEGPLGPIAGRTVLEITERASLEGIDGVTSRVGRLRELGFRIAVDDLGAGYAGLSSFVTLKPDFVKLDMTLVRGVDHDPIRQQLIRSIVDVCQQLRIVVVAEGVEVVEERVVLADLGCDLLQGFLIARPGRPFPEVADWNDCSDAVLETFCPTQPFRGCTDDSSARVSEES